MLVLTPKQEELLKFVENNGPVSPMAVGIEFGKPRKLAQKWATPALRILVKAKKLERLTNGDFVKAKGE